MLNDERSQLYVSAIMVAFVQITTIVLIIFYFNDGKGVRMVPTDTYL